MCIAPGNGTAADGSPILLGYDQRHRFLPESEILLVDDYGTEAMDGIPADGRLEWPRGPKRGPTARVLRRLAVRGEGIPLSPTRGDPPS